jgi:hypothetical protein
VQLEGVSGEVVELVGASAVRRIVEVVGGWGVDTEGFVGVVLGGGYYWFLWLVSEAGVGFKMKREGGGNRGTLTNLSVVDREAVDAFWDGAAPEFDIDVFLSEGFCL